jgi:hypothetical protein
MIPGPERPSNELPNLAGVRIYAVGAGAIATGETTTVRARAIKRFWLPTCRRSPRELPPADPRPPFVHVRPLVRDVSFHSIRIDNDLCAPPEFVAAGLAAVVEDVGDVGERIQRQVQHQEDHPPHEDEREQPSRRLADFRRPQTSPRRS